MDSDALDSQVLKFVSLFRYRSKFSSRQIITIVEHTLQRRQIPKPRIVYSSLPKSITSEEEFNDTSERARIREQIVHQNGISSTNSVQTTPEIKKRKKRPAPPPPTPEISHACFLSNEDVSSESLCVPKKDEESENLESTANVPMIDVSTDVEEEKEIRTALTSDIENIYSQCRKEFNIIVTKVDVRTIESEVYSTDGVEAPSVMNSLEKLDLDDNSSKSTGNDQKKDSISIKNVDVINIDGISNEEKNKSNKNDTPFEEVLLEVHDSKIDENDNILNLHYDPGSNNLVQV